MKYLLAILAFCVVLPAGCLPDEVALDLRDAVAVDLALATMTDHGPAPRPDPPTPYDCPRCKDTGWITHGDGHRTPCPDCNDGSRGHGGPLDTYREARELIRKGNDLADRGRAILDAAEREGRITFDVRLPRVEKPAVPYATCRDGVCPVSPNRERPEPERPERKTPREQAIRSAAECADGFCRPRVLRWRRWR
jgi:hypothetical protein